MESSVTEHRFGCSEPFTVGVEEEYMVVDPRTLELVQRVGAMLAAEEGGEFVPHARELGGDDALDGIEQILSRGNGADRQRSVFGANHDLLEVVRNVAELSAAAVVSSAA